MQRNGPTTTGLVEDAIEVARTALIAHGAVRK